MGNFRTFAKEKIAVISFGRCNPPTVGHEKLIEKVLSVAQEAGADPMVYLSQSQDSKKNPLTYNEKVDFLRAQFGSIIQKDASIKTMFDVFHKLEKMGYETVIMVIGSDRMAKMEKEVLPSISPTIHLKLVSAGERDPDAEGETGISGTKMREYAIRGDYASFHAGCPSKFSKRLSLQMFNAVRSGMNLS